MRKINPQSKLSFSQMEDCVRLMFNQSGTVVPQLVSDFSFHERLLLLASVICFNSFSHKRHKSDGFLAMSFSQRQPKFSGSSCDNTLYLLA